MQAPVEQKYKTWNAVDRVCQASPAALHLRTQPMLPASVYDHVGLQTTLLQAYTINKWYGGLGQFNLAGSSSLEKNSHIIS